MFEMREDRMKRERHLEAVLRELDTQNPELAMHFRRLDELIDRSTDLRRKTRVSLDRARQEVQKLRTATS